MWFTCTPFLFSAAELLPEAAPEVIPAGACEVALNGSLVVARA